jgi:outer membrane protein insertion porin family
MRLLSWFVAAVSTPVTVAAQQLTPSGSPDQAMPIATICGQQRAPLAQPPSGSPPVVLFIAPCFEAQGGSPLIEAQTYLYYIQLKTSEPSRNIWIPYDDGSEQIIRDDFRRLWSTNFLDNLSIETSDYTFPNGTIGKIVVYKMEERQRIKIGPDFEGSKKLEISQIDEALKANNAEIRLDTFIDPGLVRKVEGIVRDMMKEKGFTDAEVTHHITEVVGGPKLVHLTFNISEGRQVKIRRIDFIGNVAIADTRLKDQLKATKEQWWLSFMNGRGTYQETKFDDDAGRIVDFYQDLGYIKATVGAPEIRVLDDSEDGRTRWIELRIPISEGPRYRVSKFDVSGNTVAAADRLKALFGLREGDYYSLGAVRKGLEKAREVYGASGYFEFTGFPDYKFSDEPDPALLTIPETLKRVDIGVATPSVDVTMRFVEGVQYFVNRIHLTGNTTTHDSVVRRELALVEGAVFNTEALKLSVKRLNQLGYFKPLEAGRDIAVEKTPGTADKVDVRLKVEEQNRNQVNFGAGVSQYDGFFGNVTFTTANFLGRGESLTLSAQMGQRATNYQLSFTEPFLFDRPITAGFDLHSRKNDYYTSTNEISYSEVRQGVTVTGGRLLGHFTRAYLSHSYEVIDVAVADSLLDETPDSASAGVPLFNPYLDSGRHIESRLSPTLVYNTVDNPFLPRTGMRITGSYQVAGGLFGGTTSYIKPETEVVLYIPHTSRTALGLRGNTGWLRPYGTTDTLPYYLRYFLGGENQIRGVDIRTVGPVDAQNRVLGGNKFLLFNAEYYLDIWKLRALAFHDAGQAYGETERMDLRNLRTSSGAELRFMMPVVNVPFRLIYAWNIYRDVFQKDRTFRFAVGTAF